MDATQTHQEFHQHTFSHIPAFDPTYDPRWQNIYQPSSDQANNIDFMHYRQTEDALSSASSSSDGSYNSIYSASSDLANPLNFHQLPSSFTPAAAYSPAHPADPFAPTSTLAPTTNTSSTRLSSTPDDANAWMYAHDPNSPYHHQPPQSDPYATGRDSGEWGSYSSGDEEPYPSYPIPHNTFGQQQDHQHQHQHQQQQQQMFGMTNIIHEHSSPASYVGPNNPSKAPDLYTPSPPDYNRRGASFSPYPSPGQGQGNSRLATPDLTQLSIGLRYPSGPMSPSDSQPQNGGAPGPSRTSHRGMTSPSHSNGAGAASSPYGRPPHHHSHARLAGSGHQHSASTVSSNSSHSQPQYSPTGMSNSNSGKIFGNVPINSSNVVLPPLSISSTSTASSKSLDHHHHHPSSQQPMEKKPKKEMVAGTPTHPDIPRPALVAAPVPVPHLTKKSRGRQVPSVNSVSAVSDGSRERDESPISPLAGGGMHTNAGYFGHPSQQQWNTSDSEYDEMGMRGRQAGAAAAAGLGHAHRSLFGQPPALDMGYNAGASASNNRDGSTSSLSSPATSLSSRRTAPAEDPAPAPAANDLEADLKTRPFVCSVTGCGKAYIRAEHLKRHVRSIHTNDKPYECPHPGCGREFSRYDNLCQHFKGVHGPTKTAAR